MQDKQFPPGHREIKRIGIFRALYLGDMLCIIPAVRAVRKAFPSATITLIGLPWAEQFAARFPGYFNNFVGFPGWPGLPEQEARIEAIVPFLKLMRAEQFDLVLQMHGNGYVTNNLCAMWNAKYTVGVRSIFQDIPDKGVYPVSEDDDHEVLRFLKLTDALGISQQGTELEFNFIGDEFRSFKQMWASLSLTPGNYLCLHPGARDERRRWPADKFVFLADHLCALGHEIVLTGSIQEAKLLDDLQTRISYPVTNIIQRFGNVGLGELAAFIRHSKMLISNDTGVSHIASALKTPSVIIFSPYSDVGRWAPLDHERHRVIGPEENDDPEYVLYRILDHLDKKPAIMRGTFQQ